MVINWAAAEWAAAPCGQGSQEARDHGQGGEVGRTCTLQGLRVITKGRHSPGGQGRAMGMETAEARLGYLPTGGGSLAGLAQAWLATAQVSSEAQHSAQAPRLLAGQGGSPTSPSPFPTQLISHRSGSAAAPGAGPVPGEQTRGSPGAGWREPEAEAASRSWCSPAGCRESRKLEKQMCKFKLCGNFTEISMF